MKTYPFYFTPKLPSYWQHKRYTYMHKCVFRSNISNNIIDEYSDDEEVMLPDDQLGLWGMPEQ